MRSQGTSGICENVEAVEAVEAFAAVETIKADGASSLEPKTWSANAKDAGYPSPSDARQVRHRGPPGTCHRRLGCSNRLRRGRSCALGQRWPRGSRRGARASLVSHPLDPVGVIPQRRRGGWASAAGRPLARCVASNPTTAVCTNRTPRATLCRRSRDSTRVIEMSGPVSGRSTRICGRGVTPTPHRLRGCGLPACARVAEPTGAPQSAAASPERRRSWGLEVPCRQAQASLCSLLAR